MQIPPLASAPLWMSEHYWPGLVDGLVLAQAQRTALVQPPAKWVATVVVPGEQTAFGLFMAPDESHLREALAVAGVTADRLSAALQLTATEMPSAASRRR